MIEAKPILKAIRAQFSLAWYGLHGVTHWARVFENGLLVANHTQVSRDLVLLFALFHDACRRNDGIDPDHGLRGADLAAALRGESYELQDAEFELLHQACARHTDGLVRGDVVLQTCWDADRLDLARALIIPSPKHMWTAAARGPQGISRAPERSPPDHVPDLLRTDWGQDLEEAS